MPHKFYIFQICAVVSMLYCEVLGSIPGQGEICIENSISAAHPAHSAVISRLGL